MDSVWMKVDIISTFHGKVRLHSLASVFGTIPILGGRFQTVV